MRALIFSVATVILALPLALTAATNQQLEQFRHDYYLLEYLRLTYSDEIFGYCTDKHGTNAGAATSCMIKQDDYRTDILDQALDQLGRDSLAQAVYGDCVDYYPRHSVWRIRECVRTRLYLDERLQDDVAERRIYHNCDVKWRDHGFRSVDGCSAADARYFLRTGEYRD